MRLFSHSLTDPFGSQRECLRTARHARIEIVGGRLVAIHVRRWSRLVSAVEVELFGRFRHARLPGDRCVLDYTQPRRYSNYLALRYVASHRDCTLATFHRALEVLDEVARVKQSDAILCDVGNHRISDRLMARWGWQAHKPSRWHRHFIKRFYGTFPPARQPADELVAAS
ncbi:MAG TPA: hypothetical protein VL175_03650 [Pirellulales bacterium]|nr:hypothetical protein [Pirellulales bacterium]